MNDILEIPGIRELSIGKMGNMDDSELVFMFPDVLGVIQICSSKHIAVLGLEIFLVVKGGQYQAAGCSDYHIQMTQKWRDVTEHQWQDYVAESNKLAEESVRNNPRGDDHVYVLTASSWREFAETHNAKHK